MTENDLLKELKNRFKPDEYVRLLEGFVTSFLIFGSSILKPVGREETVEKRYREARLKLAAIMKAIIDIAEGK